MEGKALFGLSFFWGRGVLMRSIHCVDLAYLKSEAPKASAEVYDFGMRRTESRRQHRISALEYENALLKAVLSETGNEIARLRELLTAAD